MIRHGEWIKTDCTTKGEFCLLHLAALEKQYPRSFCIDPFIGSSLAAFWYISNA